MEILNTVLPVVINILLVVLITSGIILVIKCIYVIDKCKSVVTNVEKKVNSFNGLFTIIDKFNDKITALVEKVLSAFEIVIDKFVTHKKEDVQVVDIKVKKGKKKNG